MKIIDTRNPSYEIKISPSMVNGELMNKTLLAIDVIVNEERFTVKKKQKYLVKHMRDSWWLEEEYEQYQSPPFVHLYSVREINIVNTEIHITFAYQNNPTFTVAESEIIKLVQVGKKANRDNPEIQEMIEALRNEDSL